MMKIVLAVVALAASASAQTCDCIPPTAQMFEFLAGDYAVPIEQVIEENIFQPTVFPSHEYFFFIPVCSDC